MNNSMTVQESWTMALEQRRHSLTIEYMSAGRGLVCTLMPHGRLRVREFGGPRTSFGRVTNQRQPLLDTWEGDAPPTSLHERVCRALISARFPGSNLPPFPLAPDEQPSKITVRATDGQQAKLTTTTRTRQEHLDLDVCLSELETVALDLMRSTPTGKVQNPEFELWG